MVIAMATNADNILLGGCQLTNRSQLYCKSPHQSVVLCTTLAN